MHFNDKTLEDRVDSGPGPAEEPGDRRKLQRVPRQDVKPILEELRLMIRRSEYSQRQVEEMAGFSRGYLSQLLARNLDLKVWHLLAILDIFGQHPSDFFGRVFGGAKGGLGGDALRDFAAGSGPLEDELAASFDRLYRVGLDSISRLRQRLERYDHAFEELEARGLVRPAGADSE